MSEKSNMDFEIKDCTLITRMAGIDAAMNLRELRERVLVCPIECLFHHFCETVIRPTFDDPQFRNDFAGWAAHSLRDSVLAERLGVLNPYSLDNIEELRYEMVEIFDERLSEIDHVPWVHKGDSFKFMQAVTVVFQTGDCLKEATDLKRLLPEMTLSSIYYHFVEARRRTSDGNDDFSNWLSSFGDSTAEMRQSLQGIDFYFMTLNEVKDRLATALGGVSNEAAHA